MHIGGGPPCPHEGSGGERHRGGEAPGVSHPPAVVAADPVIEFGEAAPERGQEMRRRMGDPVDPLEGLRVGMPEVRGEIHHRNADPLRVRRLEQRGDLGSGGGVGGCREGGEPGKLAGAAAEELRDRGGFREARSLNGGPEVREGSGDRLPRVALRHRPEQPHPGMAQDPAQKLTGHITGRAEDDDPDRVVSPPGWSRRRACPLRS